MSVPGAWSWSQEYPCYFCNDVVAPEHWRTLDQQCTVTRPGASGIAASLTVDLAVSVLTHPRGTAAPATSGSESVLGAVPHTIRGSLSGFTQFTPVGPGLSQCTGCCCKVLDTLSLSTEDWDMVRKVMEYLEDLTGQTKLMNDEDLMAGVIDLADDDTFSVSSGDI